MRANTVTLAVVLLGGTLAVASAAEARGRRSPGVAFVPTATGSIGSASAASVARAEPAATLAMPRPVPPVAAPVLTNSILANSVLATPVKDVRTARTWCGSGRIVGSGAGFCEIN